MKSFTMFLVPLVLSTCRYIEWGPEDVRCVETERRILGEIVDVETDSVLQTIYEERCTRVCLRRYPDTCWNAVQAPDGTWHWDEDF